jgi:hypothetical protein
VPTLAWLDASDTGLRVLGWGGEYRFSAPGGAGGWTPGAPRPYLPGVQLKR